MFPDTVSSGIAGLYLCPSMCRKNSYYPGSIEHMKRWKLDDEDFYMSTYHQQAGATDWPIIIFDSVEQQNTCVRAHWGILPEWITDEREALKKSHMLVNARSEEIEQTKTYAPLFTSQRCIVPSTGFFEHHWLDPKGKTKVPLHITHKNEEIFGMAGIYSVWPSAKNESVISFAILTTAANALMHKIHNGGENPHRMPLIIEKDMEQEWLTGDYRKVLRYQIPADKMKAITINKIPQQFIDASCLLDPKEWKGMEWLDGKDGGKVVQAKLF